jgi:hypothetical protein
MQGGCSGNAQLQAISNQILFTTPLGRPRGRWEDNIKMNLQEVGRGCGDWMELAQDRDRWRALVSTVMNFRVPQNAVDFLISYKTI